MLQTIQQQRAAFALEIIEDAVRKLDREADAKEKKDKYKSYASALPFMIHANGLGQAAAFCKSKSSKEPIYGELYKLLSSWLIGEGKPYQGCNDLLDGVRSRDMKIYLAAQAEAIAFLTWVKQFADAFMEG
jgi:CRISPR-associated protein Cmr5